MKKDKKQSGRLHTELHCKFTALHTELLGKFAALHTELHCKFAALHTVYRAHERAHANIQKKVDKKDRKETF